MTENETTTTSPELVDYETARRLVERGWAIVPCNSNGEKRPLSRFSTARSWRDFSERLPTDEELHEWFDGGPRRAGAVLHRRQCVIDFDTKDMRAADGSVPWDGTCPWEETAHGFHLFHECAPSLRIGHDHDSKTDLLTFGSFVRLTNPKCLLEWKGDLPMYQGGAEKDARDTRDGQDRDDGAMGSSRPTNPCGGAMGSSRPADGAHTVRDSLIAAGWKSLGVRGNREDFSRPGAAHPQRCDASLFDGQSLKVWSTSAQSSAVPEEPERVKPPILSFAELRGEYPNVPPPLVDGLLRRGETMLCFGRPKVQKSLRMLSLAAAVANGGTWAGFRCDKARTLVIDNETHPAILAERFSQICGKAGCATDGVDFLPVWDREYSIEDMMRDAPHLGGYGLIIFDILARGLPDWCESESDNRQCAKVWACVQKTAALTGAAVVVVHHARKSTTADIVSDPSGAGWTRYASTVASISKREKEPGVWLEAVCRSFPSPQPRRL